MHKRSAWAGFKAHFRVIATLVVGVLAVALVPWSGADAAYTMGNELAFTSTAAPEAVELADLVPSPTYPNWFWSVSDVWKNNDKFAACVGLAAFALHNCQQVQRARVWAFRIDPASHAITAVRSFAVSNPSWALNPYVAQPNDWEDMTVGPARTNPDGSVVNNIIIGATGNSNANPARDPSGKNITCKTRRLIEFTEPNVTDPTVTSWSPWKIFDIKNYAGTHGVVGCNSEALLQGSDAGGAPQAYIVSRNGGQVFSRSLEASTGRDPGVVPVDPSSALPYAPSSEYVGVVPDSAGSKFTGADTNGTDVVLVSPPTAVKPCELYRWTAAAGTSVAETITSTMPVRDAISCKNTEGVTFTRDPADLSRYTRDLYTVADTKTPLRYWFLPWS